MNFKELRQFIGYEKGEPQTQMDMMIAIGRMDSNASWSNWESGKNVDTNSLKLIAKTFNVFVTITPEGEISFDRE